MLVATSVAVHKNQDECNREDKKDAHRHRDGNGDFHAM